MMSFLRIELGALQQEDFDLALLGFEDGERARFLRHKTLPKG